jgi:hypothetical protein
VGRHHRDPDAARPTALKVVGFTAFYLVMLVAVAVAVFLVVDSVLDIWQPVLWGTFQSHGCEPRDTSRHGCRVYGSWVSDDKSTILYRVYLDDLFGRVGTVRAMYQPTGLVNDASNNVVHAEGTQFLGTWMPWLVLAVALGVLIHYARDWGHLAGIARAVRRRPATSTPAEVRVVVADGPDPVGIDATVSGIPSATRRSRRRRRRGAGLLWDLFAWAAPGFAIALAMAALGVTKRGLLSPEESAVVLTVVAGAGIALVLAVVVRSLLGSVPDRIPRIAWLSLTGVAVAGPVVLLVRTGGGVGDEILWAAWMCTALVLASLALAVAVRVIHALRRRYATRSTPVDGRHQPAAVERIIARRFEPDQIDAPTIRPATATVTEDQ